MFKRLIASLVCLTFSLSNLQYVQAQASPAIGGDFSVNQLPVPGTMVGESAPFAPLALKGLIVNPQKPLEFQFIVDTGKGPQDNASIKDQANQLVKYFLAGLTIPEGDLWVNLSPYEKNRMVPEALGQTDLGRDLLAQDYILKQLTASLIYPEKDLGKEFWSRVYSKAQQQFGTTNVPVNTFNKVWILPDQAQVFENGNAAYVTKSTLKVMLDEDYTALQKHLPVHNSTDSIGANIVRQIILPEITKEVNTGKNFAPLRQIYQALILAKWYKETIQNGLLDALYTNKNKVVGVNAHDPKVKEEIYNRYLQAYKKGAFNYIKEDPTPDGQIVPRKYFSGGFTELGMKVRHDGAMAAVKADGAMISLTVGLFAAGAVIVGGLGLKSRLQKEKQKKIDEERSLAQEENRLRLERLRQTDPKAAITEEIEADTGHGYEGNALLIQRALDLEGQGKKWRLQKHERQEKIYSDEEYERMTGHWNTESATLSVPSQYRLHTWWTVEGTDNFVELQLSRQASNEIAQKMEEAEQKEDYGEYNRLSNALHSLNDSRGQYVYQDNGHIEYRPTQGVYTGQYSDAYTSEKWVPAWEKVKRSDAAMFSWLFGRKSDVFSSIPASPQEIDSVKRYLADHPGLYQEQGEIIALDPKNKRNFAILFYDLPNKNIFSINQEDIGKPKGEVAFMEAAKRGSLVAVSLLIERGINVNAQNPVGGTALMLASIRGHENIVDYLLEHGANPNIAESHGLIALSVASEQKVLYQENRNPMEVVYDRIVKKLIKKGSNITTAINSASAFQNYTQIQYLESLKATDQAMSHAPDAAMLGSPDHLDVLLSSVKDAVLNHSIIIHELKRFNWVDWTLTVLVGGIIAWNLLDTSGNVEIGTLSTIILRYQATLKSLSDATAKDNKLLMTKLNKTLTDIRDLLYKGLDSSTSLNSSEIGDYVKAEAEVAIGSSDPELLKKEELEIENLVKHGPQDSAMLGWLLNRNKPDIQLADRSWKSSILLLKLLEKAGNGRNDINILRDKSFGWMRSGSIEKRVIGLNTLRYLFKQKNISYSKVLLDEVLNIFFDDHSLPVKLAALDFLGAMSTNPNPMERIAAVEAENLIKFRSQFMNQLNEAHQDYVARGVLADIAKESTGKSSEEALMNVISKVDTIDAAMLIPFTKAWYQEKKKLRLEKLKQTDPKIYEKLELELSKIDRIGSIETLFPDALKFKKEGYDFKVIFEPERSHSYNQGSYTGYYGNSDEKINEHEVLRIEPDKAMFNQSSENGGIDLNQINVLRNGKTVNVYFDPAQLIALEQGGFKGFTPVIINITRISSPFQLLGINTPKKEMLLAKA